MFNIRFLWAELRGIGRVPAWRTNQSKNGLRKLLHRRNHDLQAVWIDDIVGVEVFEISSAGKRRRTIAVRIITEILFIHMDLYARVGCVTARDFHGVVL